MFFQESSVLKAKNLGSASWFGTHELLNYPLVLSNIAMDNDSFLDFSPSPFLGVQSRTAKIRESSTPTQPFHGFTCFFFPGFSFFFFHVCLLIIDLWIVVYSFFHGVYRYILGFTCFFPVFFFPVVFFVDGFWRQATCWAGFWSSKDASLAPRKMVTSRVVSSGPASAMIPGSMMNNDSLDWFKGKFTGNHGF